MFVCTYLLPFRRANFIDYEILLLAGYFELLRMAGCQVLAIDGSSNDVFIRHDELLRTYCQHEPVERHYGYTNDKTNGIHTGIALATCEKVILADDDIRYSTRQLRQVLNLLDEFDVVRPQNFLKPLPWWGKMEAARMLINRAFLRVGDYTGTCAFRRTVMLRTGHYDGDVLFDNEELLRHFAFHGCRIAYAKDLFVEKEPPTFPKWIEQRPRQAYEDFGLRAKTALFIMLLPALLAIGVVYGAKDFGVWAGLGALLSVLLAYLGRARGKAKHFFPIQCCWFAPVWVLERCLSTYWALYWYCAHGGYPFGDRILSRGIGRDWHRGRRVAPGPIVET